MSGSVRQCVADWGCHYAGLLKAGSCIERGDRRSDYDNHITFLDHVIVI